MKLDPRIVSISHILSPIETEEAAKYIGEMCYFADGFYTFSDLDKCPKAKLEKIHYDSKDFPYEWNEDFEQYTYILPVKFVEKPKKDKYVPFETLNDLRDYKIRIGDPIVFFNKEYPEIRYSTIVTEIQFDNDNFNIIGITLGSTTYSLETLCNNYIWHCCNNKWVPFGKKVKE